MPLSLSIVAIMAILIILVFFIEPCSYKRYNVRKSLARYNELSIHLSCNRGKCLHVDLISFFKMLDPESFAATFHVWEKLSKNGLVYEKNRTEGIISFQKIVTMKSSHQQEWWRFIAPIINKLRLFAELHAIVTVSCYYC